MASAISTVSTTAENQAYELLSKLGAEITTFATANPATDLQSLRVTKAIDAPNKRATFTVVLPLTETFDTDGGTSYDATEVMV